jgi:methionyl aminopeptidase
MIKIKTEEEIKIMGEAGNILAKVVKEVASMVKPGITTKELDEAAEGLILSMGAKPSFKGYNGFPATLCTSVNEELIHCIPSGRVLLEGDIVTLDGGAYFKGFHSDMAVTVPVGQVDPETLRLIKVTKKALKRGIARLKPGVTFGDIGNSIQRYVESQGYGVVRDFCGHGIGENLHEEPQIDNYGKRKTGEVVKEGMVFCIEPMVSMGDYALKKAKDGYGYQTKDGSLCAHFEHMIAITKSGPKILTELDK